MTEHQKPSQKTRGFFATLSAVAWSFTGLRRKKDFDEDVGGLNPVYVIVAGLIGVLIFIGVLITIVKLVVA